MKKLPLCLLTAILFIGCDRTPKAEEEEATPRPKPPATIKAATPAAATDWMWKNSKGKPRENDPLKVTDDPLENKAKK